MLRRLALCLFLAWPMSSQANSKFSPDIRHVQTDSTDVFEVLTILQQAKTALSNREYLTARQKFENVLMHDTELLEARNGLQRTLIALGDIKAAYPLITDMNSADGIIIRIRSGEVKSPLELLKTTVQENPDPRLWTLMGQLQDAHGEYSAARQAYAMAGLAGARPGLAENNIGHSHWLAKEFEMALDAFSKARTLDPTDEKFDNNWRRALIHFGQTQDAITGLEAERASLFLDRAADKAVLENENKLARLLYRKSLEMAPRHNPQTAEKLARLEK